MELDSYNGQALGFSYCVCAFIVGIGEIVKMYPSSGDRWQRHWILKPWGSRVPLLGFKCEDSRVSGMVVVLELRVDLCQYQMSYYCITNNILIVDMGLRMLATSVTNNYMLDDSNACAYSY